MGKPFIVTSLGHSFRFVPEEIGYSVSEIGVRGVNTQGDTFEEALVNAHEASRLMAEFRIEMKAGGGGAKRPRRQGQNRVRAMAGVH